MATNLLIGYPDIPFRASLIASPTAATGYPNENLITGPRGNHYKKASAAITAAWDFDLGSGITASAQYYYIARADLLRKADSADIQTDIHGDDNSGFTSPESNSDTWGISDLVGPRSEDFIYTFTAMTAYRYWRVAIDTTLSLQHQFSKLYFGTFFDFGTDPIYPRVQKREPRNSSARDSAYTFTFTWRGVRNTTRNSFVDKIVKYKDTNPLILYTASYHDILNEHRLIHGMLKDVNIEVEQFNLNTITATFEEII